MRVITVEPVIFVFIFAAAMAAPLLQLYIYEEVSEYHNFTKREGNTLCENTNVSDDIARLENLVQTQTSHWLIGLGLSGKYCSTIVFNVIVLNCAPPPPPTNFLPFAPNIFLV